MELFLVGWKNVFRNKRRSILNIIALTVGMSIMVLGLGWVQGYGTYIYQSLIDFETGHIQVLPQAYLDEAARLPVDVTVPDYRSSREDLLGNGDVQAVTGRVNFSMELGNGTVYVRMLGRGIDPAQEARVTVLHNYISSGDYLTAGPGILVGKPMAEKLAVKPGDTMYVKARDRYNVENVVDVKVVGVFDFGYPAMDQNLVFMDLKTASTLLSLNNEVTRLVVRLKAGTSPAAALSSVRETVRKKLPGGDALVAKSWKEFAQTAVTGVQSDTFSFWVTLTVIYLLIVLGILNSMSMSIHERTGEIGTLRAIGIRRGRLVTLFLWEAVSIAVLAAIAALVISLPLAYYLGRIGVDVSSSMPAEIPIPFGTRFHADFRLWHFLFSFGVSALTGVAGSFIPARRAARLNIARAMSGRR